MTRWRAGSLRDLESGLRAQVPDGKTVIFTLGAPILEPRKLIAALTETLVSYLKSSADEVDQKKTIIGNRVRFLVLGDKRWTANVVGFAFTGHSKLVLLVNACGPYTTESARRRLASAAWR